VALSCELTVGSETGAASIALEKDAAFCPAVPEKKFTQADSICFLIARLLLARHLAFGSNDSSDLP
jgi:hypothetical protein